jgi:hypothetical protein
MATNILDEYVTAFQTQHTGDIFLNLEDHNSRMKILFNYSYVEYCLTTRMLALR